MPFMTTYGATFQISAPELPFFQRRAGYLVLVKPLGDHRQARGTHINVRKPHKVRFSCHETFKFYLQMHWGRAGVHFPSWLQDTEAWPTRTKPELHEKVIEDLYLNGWPHDPDRDECGTFGRGHSTSVRKKTFIWSLGRILSTNCID